MTPEYRAWVKTPKFSRWAKEDEIVITKNGNILMPIYTKGYYYSLYKPEEVDDEMEVIVTRYISHRDDQKTRRYPKGRKIFEHDVLEWKTIGSYSRKPHYGIVIYIKETAQFAIQNAHWELGDENAHIEPFCACGDFIDETGCIVWARSHFKVVGNIYQNPGKRIVAQCLEETRKNKEKQERQRKYTPHKWRGGKK